MNLTVLTHSLIALSRDPNIEVNGCASMDGLNDRTGYQEIRAWCGRYPKIMIGWAHKKNMFLYHHLIFGNRHIAGSRQIVPNLTGQNSNRLLGPKGPRPSPFRQVHQSNMVQLVPTGDWGLSADASVCLNWSSRLQLFRGRLLWWSPRRHDQKKGRGDEKHPRQNFKHIFLEFEWVIYDTYYDQTTTSSSFVGMNWTPWDSWAPDPFVAIQAFRAGMAIDLFPVALGCLASKKVCRFGLGPTYETL